MSKITDHPIFKTGLLIALLGTAAIGSFKGATALREHSLSYEIQEADYAQVQAITQEWPELRPMIKKAIADQKITIKEYQELEAQSLRGNTRTRIKNIETLINTPTPQK